jgi:hypothetical protein
VSHQQLGCGEGHDGPRLRRQRVGRGVFSVHSTMSSPSWSWSYTQGPNAPGASTQLLHPHDAMRVPLTISSGCLWFTWGPYPTSSQHGNQASSLGAVIMYKQQKAWKYHTQLMPIHISIHVWYSIRCSSYLVDFACGREMIHVQSFLRPPHTAGWIYNSHRLKSCIVSMYI